MPPDSAQAWAFLPWGYLATIAVELPVLAVGLAPRHPPAVRVLAALGLTAFTYPVVICVLPPLVWPAWGHDGYVLAAETFAALGEIGLFLVAFGRGSARRDAAAIAAANLLSFMLGEVWHAWN